MKFPLLIVFFRAQSPELVAPSQVRFSYFLLMGFRGGRVRTEEQHTWPTQMSFMLRQMVFSLKAETSDTQKTVTFWLFSVCELLK